MTNIAPADLTAIILTYNEIVHIERAIASVRPIARTIVVVDSNSDDGTPEHAAALGATVLQNPFVNQARQFAWAIEHARIDTAWILRLDADEVIEPDLAAMILTRLPTLAADVAGITLSRKHIFMGRWIRHGGRYPLKLLRIWRRGQGRIEDRWMDEHVVIWGGRTIDFDGGFADHNLKNLSYFTAKHNGYATREAIEILSQKYGLLPRDESLSATSAPAQASRRRFAKERLYNRLPFWLSSSSYFCYRYVIQFGFLDGRAGLIYHVLQGFWYRFLAGAKVEEFERLLAGAQDNEERLRRLSAATGYRLAATDR